LGSFLLPNQELSLACLVASTSLCCSMPSATPGRSQALVFIEPVSVACHPLPRPWPPNWYFGANYRIQRLTLHLSTSPQLHGSLSALGVEFPFSLFRLR